MRIWIFSVLFISLIGCKKESSASNINQKDTTSIVEKPKPNSLITKSAQPEIFSFVTELCDSKGYFDTAKYSREELEGTYKLWFQMGGVQLDTPSVFDFDDLQKIRQNKNQILNQLDKDFAEKKKIVENLKVANVPYWQDIKKLQAKSLHQEYEKKKLQIAAYSDPSILIDNKFTENCKNFAKALNSTDDEMIAEWRKLREEMSKRNGDPQRIINEFENHLKSSNWKEYAIIDLITFGWGNCANADIENPQHNEKMNKEFDALFIKINSECDEP